MLYEIKHHYKNNQRKFNVSYIATEIKFGKKDGFAAIGFKQEGKNSFTWKYIETSEYCKKKYQESCELVVAEATTGRRVYTFNY